MNENYIDKLHKNDKRIADLRLELLKYYDKTVDIAQFNYDESSTADDLEKIYKEQIKELQRLSLLLEVSIQKRRYEKIIEDEENGKDIIF